MLKKYLSRFFLDANEKAFIRHCETLNYDKPVRDPDGEILIDLFPVSSSIIVFSHFLAELQTRRKSRIVSFSSETGFNGLINRHSILKKTQCIFRSFGVTGHVRVSRFKPSIRARASLLYADIRSRRLDKQAFLALNAEGIKIGDLIYDSYLREHNLPTINFEDQRFWKMVDFACRVLYFWIEYLESHTVYNLIISHEVYIIYGIIARLAMSQNIPVYSIGDMQLYHMDEKNYLNSLSFLCYKKIFAGLNDNEQIMARKVADDRLKKRLSGHESEDLVYAAKSSYGEANLSKRVLKESSKFKVLIATHCFLDNPHGYRWMVFPDFLEWLEFIGGMANELDYDFYLKTHVDVLKENIPIIASIIARYPKLIWLSSDVSHQQLIAEGIDAVLTVHGTIAHEYAYLGKTVVCAGDNPHIEYNFSLLATNSRDYREIIINLPNLELNIDKNEIREFAYMHYQYFSVSDWLFRDFNDYLSYIGGYGQRHVSRVYRYYLDNYSKPDSIQQIRQIIGNYIDSGEYYLHRGMYS